MSRVLISFLGTGRIKKNASSREYEPTKYRIGDKDYNCTFVSIALRKHFNIDKLILIGTTHSMWEEVYRVYTDKDDEIWTEIGDKCDKNKYDSELLIPHQDKIEKSMGNGSKVVLVKYGINIEEIKQNSEIILGLEKVLSRGDELFVDITHSFRSLPLYIMNLLVYLRDVSLKQIKISGIYYGMLEASREMNFTPVIDLSEVMNINSWISGAYSFMEFGNAYKIATLIENSEIESPKAFSNPLKNFTDSKNLNHLAEMENQVGKLQVLRKTDNLPSIARMVIDPVIGDFLNTVKIGTGKFKHSDFQYQLSIWQKNNHNYAAAYISLHEAILTRACELVDFDSSNYNDRENMKVAFRWARGKHESEAAKTKLKDLALYEYLQEYQNSLKSYAVLYKNVGVNRNAIAHCLKDQNGRITNTVSAMIQKLKQFIGEYKNNFLC